MMPKYLLVVLLAVICACVIVDAQGSAFGQNQKFGQTFEEVIVSSDLNVRRKSKENRQGKKLLTNIPSATLTNVGNPVVSRLISDDGSRVVAEKRNRRNAVLKFHSLDLLQQGAAKYSRHSKSRI